MHLSLQPMFAVFLQLAFFLAWLFSNKMNEKEVLSRLSVALGLYVAKKRKP